MENSRHMFALIILKKDYICVEHIDGNIDKLFINVNEETRERKRRRGQIYKLIKRKKNILI